MAGAISCAMFECSSPNLANNRSSNSCAFGLLQEISARESSFLVVSLPASLAFHSYLLFFILLSTQAIIGEQTRCLTCHDIFNPLLSAYEDSIVNILGGELGLLEAADRSQVNFSGGSIEGSLHAAHTSQVSFSGGSIGYCLQTHWSSQVYMPGGTVDDWLLPQDNSSLTIDGSGFAVDGIPFGYGELTSIFGGWYTKEPYRYLTGTLASGEPIDNGFRIGNDAKIVLIPAPGALLLGLSKL
ncbi:hypothetical protein ES703_82029 [subsurface metagenome]